MVWVPSKELPVPAQPENFSCASIARSRAIRLYSRDVFMVACGKNYLSFITIHIYYYRVGLAPHFPEKTGRFFGNATFHIGIRSRTALDSSLPNSGKLRAAHRTCRNA